MAALAACAAATGVFVEARAHAHIDMEGELKGRGGDQKAAPCEGEPRSDTPYEFEPGATIKLGVLEGIPHDGYFRVSFDDDGTDFEDPQSIAPINPDRYGPGKKCQGTAADRCGESDFCNMTSDGRGPTVLWDNLDPHLGADVTFGQTRFWNIELPNVECDNCTLQVMQVMEDPAGGAHGPFDGKNDLYYRCIDIVLKKGVGKTPGTSSEPAENDGVRCDEARSPNDADDDEAGDDEVSNKGSGGDGGCSAGTRAQHGSSLLALLLALAWTGRKRARRS